jgi:hypothetical protein
MHDIAHTTPDAGWEWKSEVCSDRAVGRRLDDDG